MHRKKKLLVYCINGVENGASVRVQFKIIAEKKKFIKYFFILQLYIWALKHSSTHTHIHIYNYTNYENRVLNIITMIENKKGKKKWFNDTITIFNS